MSIKSTWLKVRKWILATLAAAAAAIAGFLGLDDAESADPTYAVAWTLPTQYTDGSTMPAGTLASTTIAYRVGTAPVTLKVVPTPATSTTIPKALGTTCASAFVTTTGGIASAATAEVCVSNTGPPRAPTGLTIE
jgi:hypothetical protein